VKINSPHQFSPIGGINPKEFKEKQRAIKENRRSGAMSAGPQSQILDGVTYEDFTIRVIPLSFMMQVEGNRCRTRTRVQSAS
jgi:adducin